MNQIGAAVTVGIEYLNLARLGGNASFQPGGGIGEAALAVVQQQAVGGQVCRGHIQGKAGTVQSGDRAAVFDRGALRRQR